MDNIDEQAVRARLRFVADNPPFVAGSEIAADTLALLDAKDAEIARRRGVDALNIGFSMTLDEMQTELDEARAQIATMQAAMVETDRRAKAYVGDFGEFTQLIVEPLQPHLPKPAPDPLVDLIRSEMASDEHPISDWEMQFAAKIRALLEKKP